MAVGLVYDAKARFRSRALVRVGEPVGMAQWAEAYRRDERATVRAVTEDLAVQLARVNPSYSSWEQAEQLARLAAVVVRSPDGSGATEVGLADQVEAAARLAGGAGRVPGVAPAAVRRLRGL